nr:MAG TPA_asm: hypothetical protein [Caudoviricetes sp.]
MTFSNNQLSIFISAATTRRRWWRAGATWLN